MARLIALMISCFVLTFASGPATILAAPGAPSDVAPANALVTSYCAEPEEVAFLKRINSYRAQNGLGPVALSLNLSRAAENHSLDMAANNYFSHTLFDGTTWSQNLSNHGYAYSTHRGENIAAGNESAENSFQQWKNSPGHDANMLSGSFNAIGIGRVYDADSKWKYYWTTTFGGFVDQLAPSCDGGTPGTGSDAPAAPAAPVPAPETKSGDSTQPEQPRTVAPRTTTEPRPSRTSTDSPAQSPTSRTSRTSQSNAGSDDGDERTTSRPRR